MLKLDIITKAVTKIDKKTVKAVGGLVVTAGMAVFDAIEQKQQKKTVAELVKRVAELEQKVNK